MLELALERSQNSSSCCTTAPVPNLHLAGAVLAERLLADLNTAYGVRQTSSGC